MMVGRANNFYVIKLISLNDWPQISMAVHSIVENSSHSHLLDVHTTFPSLRLNVSHNLFSALPVQSTQLLESAQALCQTAGSFSQ